MLWVGEQSTKTKKIAVLTILVAIIALVVPASVVFSSQSIGNKTENIVEIAENAQQSLMDLVAFVTADADAMYLITEAELEDDFYGNVSLCVEEGTTFGDWTAIEDGEGWTCLEDANSALTTEEYEDAIDYAKEVLTIFRDAFRSIHVILCEAGVEIGHLLEPEILQEALDRSQERIDQLRDLLADEEMLAVLNEAEGMLSDAQAYLESENIDYAKDSLREANELISQVCQDLRQIAQELNPQRIRNYCEEAFRYRERFRGRFREAENEGFDVDGFLQQFGYQNEDEFMTRFQEMIQNTENGEDLEDVFDDLEDIGYLIRQMDQNLTEEMYQYRAQNGQDGTDSGFGQTNGGYGQKGGTSSFGGQEGSGSVYGQNDETYSGSSGSGQMDFAGNQ